MLEYIHTHAWLNLWDKHMTTGRINRVFTLQPLLCSASFPTEQGRTFHMIVRKQSWSPSDMSHKVGVFSMQTSGRECTIVHEFWVIAVHHLTIIARRKVVIDCVHRARQTVLQCCWHFIVGTVPVSAHFPTTPLELPTFNHCQFTPIHRSLPNSSRISDTGDRRLLDFPWFALAKYK